MQELDRFLIMELVCYPQCMSIPIQSVHLIVLDKKSNHADMVALHCINQGSFILSPSLDVPALKY